MIHFLGSILCVTMLELSIELPSSGLIEACAHCAKLLSKVYVEQHLVAFVLFLWQVSYYNTDSPLISISAGTQHCAAVAVLNMYPVHDLNGLDAGRLYFTHCAWTGFGGGKAREDKLHVCYCLCGIQDLTRYMHTLLVCYSRVFCKFFEQLTRDCQV